MMFQTTRRRLAIWYTALTAVLLLLLATGVYFYVRGTLIERIDDTLLHVIEVVKRSIIVEPIDDPPPSPAVLGGQFQVNIKASFRDNSNAIEDDHIDLEWFGSHGDLLWYTFKEPLDIPLKPNRYAETVESNSIILRQVTETIRVGRQVLGYLRVSHPWFEVTKPIQLLAWDLVIGMGLTLVSIGAIGWFLSGLAIEPVRESYQRLRQFTADASHELRNPIATIQTNVQVALGEPDLDWEERQKQLELIERLTRRLGHLVDDLLFLARYDSGILQLDFISVPLDELLMQVVEEQSIIAHQNGVSISLDFMDSNLTENEEENFVLMGDSDRLARLFTNLLSNAVQYTPSGGKVIVKLQVMIKGKLQVVIQDTGVGISPTDLPHVFDRFYRVDPARSKLMGSGSGLGLSIVQAIVESYQGHITIDSQLNHGTTVTVILPTNHN